MAEARQPSTVGERSPPRDDGFDLLSMLGVLWTYRWLVIGLTGVVCSIYLGFLIASVMLPPNRSPMPNVYRSTALLLVNEQSNLGGAQALIEASGLSPLASLGGLTAGASYGELAVHMLKSNTILDVIAADFGLTERYRVTRSPRGNTRRQIVVHTTFVYDERTRLLSIGYEDRDAELAARITNRFVELLEARFSTIGANRSIRNRDLLRNKISEVEAAIQRLEGAIESFQRRYGALSPDVLATEQATVLGGMRAQLIAKEIEIETYTSFSRVDDPAINRLRAERDSLKSSIAVLEARYSTNDQGANIPAIAVEYARLDREARVQGQVYQALTQQYELAKLSVEGQDPIFQVLELGEVPDLKSGPRRTVMGLSLFITTFLVSVLSAFLVNAIQATRSDPERMRKLSGRRRPAAG